MATLFPAPPCPTGRLTSARQSG